MPEEISFSEFEEKFSSAVGMVDEKFKSLADKFYRLTSLLLEENEKTNLTAIKDIDSVILKHYVDCLMIVKYIPEGAKMIDVGCGGGFPTLPIAIARPDLSITALDSTAKKLEFVGKAAKELSLNVVTLPRRAEDVGREENYREKFDVVTARAVSALPVLSELCIPLVKMGGCFIAMKGSSGHEEYESAKSGIKKLGAVCSEHLEMLGDMQRFIYVCTKISNTPSEYPRMYSKIVKAPLK